MGLSSSWCVFFASSCKFKRSPTFIIPSKYASFHSLSSKSEFQFINSIFTACLFQSRAVLLGDHHILSSFLNLIRNSTAEFQRFPNGTAVVQRLTRLELELQSMITVLKRLERILGFVSNNSFNDLFFLSIGVKIAENVFKTSKYKVAYLSDWHGKLQCSLIGYS